MSRAQSAAGAAAAPALRAAWLERAACGLRLFFTALLVVTAIGKLLDNRGFAEVIASYRLAIPAALLLPAGLALSLGELLIGVGMLARVQLLALAAVNAALQFGYLLLALATLLRGISLDNCGCFGVFLARPLGWQTVAEDGLLLVLALALWAAERGAQRSGTRTALRAVPGPRAPSAQSR